MGISRHWERSPKCGTMTLPTEALSFIVWSITTYPSHLAHHPARSMCHCDAAPREKNFFYVADLRSGKCSINPFKKQSSCSGPEEEQCADNTQMGHQLLRTNTTPL